MGLIRLFLMACIISLPELFLDNEASFKEWIEFIPISMTVWLLIRGWHHTLFLCESNLEKKTALRLSIYSTIYYISLYAIFILFRKQFNLIGAIVSTLMVFLSIWLYNAKQVTGMLGRRLPRRQHLLYIVSTLSLVLPICLLVLSEAIFLENIILITLSITFILFIDRFSSYCCQKGFATAYDYILPETSIIDLPRSPNGEIVWPAPKINVFLVFSIASVIILTLLFLLK